MANVSSVKTNVKTGEVDGFYDPQFQLPNLLPGCLSDTR